MLRFAFQDEPLQGPPPPTLPAGATVRWRPLVPVTIRGPTGLVRQFGRAVLDPAADDTVFPLDTAGWIGARLRPDTGHRIRWCPSWWLVDPNNSGSALLCALCGDNGFHYPSTRHRVKT